jgi:hypothetical protein
MRLAALEELDVLQLCVPAMVDAYDAGDLAFPDAVKSWLVAVEQKLALQRLPAAAGVAALRATLIAASHGVLPEGMSGGARTTPRKLHGAVAARVLRQAEELVVEATRVAAGQVAEADRFARQMAAAASRKGLAASAGTPDSIWSRCEADPELAPVAAHVAGLVGAADAIVLFQRWLDQP